MSSPEKNSNLSPSLSESPGAVPHSDTVNRLRVGLFQMKENTFYFQHDNTSHADEKILDLRSELGYEGYGIFWALLELLHQNSGKLQMNSKRIAFALQVDEQILDKVINNYGLFIIEGEYFYSRRLLNQIEYRAEIVEKRREAGAKGGKMKANAKQMLSKKLPKERKGKESKGEDSKEKKEKDIFKDEVFSFSQYPDAMLEAFFAYWSESDKKGTMRWQKEKTWETNLRLIYWSNRNKKPTAVW